jgi:hypothetical protein
MNECTKEHEKSANVITTPKVLTTFHSDMTKTIAPIMVETTPLIKRGRTLTRTFYYTREPYQPIYNPCDATPSLNSAYIRTTNDMIRKMMLLQTHIHCPSNGIIKINPPSKHQKLAVTSPFKKSMKKKTIEAAVTTINHEQPPENKENLVKMNHSSHTQLSTYNTSRISTHGKYALKNLMHSNRGGGKKTFKEGDGSGDDDDGGHDYVNVEVKKSYGSVSDKRIIPKKKLTTTGKNHNTLTIEGYGEFELLQARLIHSLQLHDDLKVYINTCLTEGITRGKLRIPLTSFIKTPNFLENISDLKAFESRYQYVKYSDFEHSKAITHERLSADWFDYDSQYQFVSQILIYLNHIRVKYVITKMPIEIGLKSIFQDDIDYSVNTMAVTTTPTIKENDNVKKIDHVNDITTVEVVKSSSSSSPSFFMSVIDYITEVMPLKMKRFGYYYLIYIDLALTETKTKVDFLAKHMKMSNK